MELTDISRDIVNLVIEGRNDIVRELEIINHEHLESIEIQKESLRNIHSLTIKHNPLLKRIVVNNSACSNCVTVNISSWIQ